MSQGGVRNITGDSFFCWQGDVLVVRSVARAHGGRLELQSRPGQGTRASVVLPLLRNAGVTEASVHG